MGVRKPVEFVGSSLDDLRSFPLAARREAGHQFDQLQSGLDPDDWKPMPAVGAGAREIRIRDASGAFRVMYVAKRRRRHLRAPLFSEEDPEDKQDRP